MTLDKEANFAIKRLIGLHVAIVIRNENNKLNKPKKAFSIT